MKKTMISVLFAILAFVVCLSAALAESPMIESVEYEGRGRVDVEFVRDVRLGSCEVIVTDALGSSNAVKIVRTDDDDLLFEVFDTSAGEYSFTINGAGFESVSGTFTIPEAAPNGVSITEVKHEPWDREIDVEFGCRVSYENPVVSVKNENGVEYTATIVEKDNDSLELRVSELASGRYMLSVSGVAQRGNTDFGTVSSEFTVR